MIRAIQCGKSQLYRRKFEMQIDVMKEKSLGAVAAKLKSIAPAFDLAQDATKVHIQRAAGALTHPRTRERHEPFYLLTYYRDSEYLGTMRIIFDAEGEFESFRKPARKTA